MGIKNRKLNALALLREEQWSKYSPVRELTLSLSGGDSRKEWGWGCGASPPLGVRISAVGKGGLIIGFFKRNWRKQ